MLFGWAAWTLDRVLSQAVSVAWMLTAGLHLIFHAGHLGGFGTADAAAEIATLGLLLLPPALVLQAAAAASPPPEAPRP